MPSCVSRAGLVTRSVPLSVNGRPSPSLFFPWDRIRKRAGLADVRLLRAGESEGGWRLDGIERDGAVFRQGDEIRRLPIPPR